MAPISPVSRKRSTPPQSDDDTMDQPASKKVHLEAALPHTPPPEEVPEVHMETPKLFNDDPRELLSRSVALILEHVGFTGASQEALEAICAQADTYATNFLGQITSSMLSARRAQPTPLDFQHALSEFSLPMASLEPHLHPPVAPIVLNLELEPPLPEELSTASLALLLGDALSGEPDKKAKTYIPYKFPSFPSRHTYKWTEKESTREKDQRKIREEAAKDARQAEGALRHLTKLGTAGKEKDIKKIASRDPKSKQRHELWEEALEGLLTEKRNGIAMLAEDDRSMTVNSEKLFLRKPPVTKRKRTLV